MRAILQRVSSASVSVDGEVVGQIGQGLVVLVAAHREDTEANAGKMADRVWGCRIFNDAEGKINLALKDFGGSGGSSGKSGENGENGEGGPVQLSQLSQLSPSPAVLAVSNFTVYGDTTQRRPSFVESAPYDRGKELFDRFVEGLRKLGCPVETGVFGAHMEVSLVNDGPVTVIAEA
ncbi:MAG: D-aminoacyl-tRNA deacylase [Armatimonadetes bacterium]|nr:D-aminoacyl-tRNA deacylase [Armatimonadota bacterium]